MELILTQTVESEYHKKVKMSKQVLSKTVYDMNFFLFFVTELGGRGDTVFVKKSVGRNKLLAQGLAVYPSPENKQIFAEELRVCTAFIFCHIFQRF